MKDINCPHCHKAFKVDEAGYADILKQVRNSEFEDQLHQRLELAEKEKLNGCSLVRWRMLRILVIMNSAAGLFLGLIFRLI